MNCTYDRSRVGSQYAKTTEIYAKNIKSPKIKHRYNGNTAGNTTPIGIVQKSCKTGRMGNNEKGATKLSRSSIMTANS